STRRARRSWKGWCRSTDAGTCITEPRTPGWASRFGIRSTTREAASRETDQWLAGTCCGDATTRPFVVVHILRHPSKGVVGLPQGDVAAGLPLSVVVAINDAHGDRVHGPTFDVTLALEPNPQGATLSGTLTQTALDGIATFRDVHISRAGRSFALSATGNSISASSPRFDVRLRLTS